MTAHGDTMIEFASGGRRSCTDRTDLGFKTHHRIAAAKELIVHILRDEQPAFDPSPSTGQGGARPESRARLRACPVTKKYGE